MDDFKFERVKRGAEAPAADPLRDDFRKRITGDEAEVLHRLSFLANFFGAETSASQTKVVMTYLIDLLQKSGALVFDTDPDDDPYCIQMPDYVRTGTIATLLVWLREQTEKAKAKMAAGNSPKPAAAEPQAKQRLAEQTASPAPAPEPAPAPSFSLSQADLDAIAGMDQPVSEPAAVTAEPQLEPELVEEVASVERDLDGEEGDAKNQLPMTLDHPEEEDGQQGGVELVEVAKDSNPDGNQDEEKQVTRKPARPDFGATMARDKK